MKLKSGDLKDKQNWWTFRQTNQEKIQRAQINKIRNEREVTTDTRVVQNIKWDYYEQLHANKIDKPEKNG